MKKNFTVILLFLLISQVYSQTQDVKHSKTKVSVIPAKISYQGVLTDDSGTPLNGKYTMTFGLFTTETGGNSIWSETQNNVQVTNGIFNVYLGSVNSLSELPFNQPYWLAIRVNSTTLSPRIELTSSAYSFRSNYAKFSDTSRIAQRVVPYVDLLLKRLTVYNNDCCQTVIFSKDYDYSEGSNPTVEVWNHGNGEAIYAKADNDYAAYFDGDVHITGTLSKGGGSFEIDHPLDPENKILRHSFVESPDMMNVYNGNVITNENGVATVKLPKYFEALNKDFKYQLTVIGEFAQAIVKQEIQDNHFTIKTNKPNVKVSWQVTGIRKDPWAEKNRIVVEEQKSKETKGYYLNPEAYGLSITRSIDYVLHSEMRENLKKKIAKGDNHVK